MIGRLRVGLGIGIVVAIVLASCAPRPIASPVSTATTGPTATAGPTGPGPTPSAASSPAATGDTSTWTLESSLSAFEVADLVSLDGRIVAAGCVVNSGGCAGASIAVLDSGQWSASAFDGDAARLRLSAIAAGDAGLVAVGHVRDGDDTTTWRAAALVSTDGQAWRAAPNQGSLQGRVMVDVTELPGVGWIAVGTTVTPSVFVGFETWLSRDGLAWDLIASLGPIAVVHGVAAFDGGLIAWGTDCLDVCGPPARAALWTSADGRSWTRVQDQPSLTGGSVDSVIPTSGGALAVGSVYDRDGFAQGVVWVTADGSTWEQTLLPGSAAHQFFRITEAADGFVAVGAMITGNDSAWRTWHSPDGASWTRLTGSDVPADRLELVSVAGDVLAVAVDPATDHGSSYLLRLRIE